MVAIGKVQIDYRSRYNFMLGYVAGVYACGDESTRESLRSLYGIIGEMPTLEIEDRRAAAREARNATV
jgi:hypothetical protein